MRYLVTRTFAYCLSYEDGIAFSKGGLSSQDEPPVSVHDHLGVLGVDRRGRALDRACSQSQQSRAACRDLRCYRISPSFATMPPPGSVHHASDIDVWTFDPDFLDALEPRIERNLSLTLVRTEGQLYVTTGGTTLEGALEHSKLLETRVARNRQELRDAPRPRIFCAPLASGIQRNFRLEARISRARVARRLQTRRTRGAEPRGH